MAGANGARSWLQARHLTWLTPRRLRIATVALFAAAALASSLSLSGSNKPPSRLAPQHALVQAR